MSLKVLGSGTSHYLIQYSLLETVPSHVGLVNGPLLTPLGQWRSDHLQQTLSLTQPRGIVVCGDGKLMNYRKCPKPCGPDADRILLNINKNQVSYTRFQNINIVENQRWSKCLMNMHVGRPLLRSGLTSECTATDTSKSIVILCTKRPVQIG